MQFPNPHQRFKHIRLQLGLSQSDFAAAAHIKQAQVSQIETGTRAITDSIYAALEHHLGASQEWIKTETGEPFTRPVTLASPAQREYSEQLQVQRLRSGLKNINMPAQAQRLREFREAEAISTEQMASELNVSTSTLYKYENAKLYLPVEVPVYLHDKYRMSYEWFFNGIMPRKISRNTGMSPTITIDDLYETQAVLTAKIDYLQKQLKTEQEHRKRIQRQLAKTPTQL